MMNAVLNSMGKPLFKRKNMNPLISQNFFGWLNIAFNQVDVLRKQQVGADRVCTEWILRNGGSVKWVGTHKYVQDYNALPPDNTILHVEKINATGSSISHYGFMHLDGCKHVNEIKLSDCSYIENEALKQLIIAKDSLQHLHVSYCANITKEGVLHIKYLSNLKTLELYHLQFVQKKLNILKELETSLPNCEIKSDFEKK